MTSLTAREALSKATAVLRSHGLETARLDAEVLLAFVLKTSRSRLYIDSEKVLSGNDLAEFFSLVDRRLNREPIAYITGEKEFMSLIFKVNRNVLIPRPETEILVEWVIEKVNKLLLLPDNPIILDVGTGSGAIAISLARYLPQAEIWATDISAQALELARLNAKNLAVEDRITFLNSDLLTGIPARLKGKAHFVVANLPYIPAEEIPHLPAEVAGYEPHIALDGGGDGLDLYRKLIPQAREILAAGGWLCMETGMSQTKTLASLLPASNWGEGIQVLKDYAGLDRFIVARNRI